MSCETCCAPLLPGEVMPFAGRVLCEHCYDAAVRDVTALELAFPGGSIDTSSWPQQSSGRTTLFESEDEAILDLGPILERAS